MRKFAVLGFLSFLVACGSDGSESSAPNAGGGGDSGTTALADGGDGGASSTDGAPSVSSDCPVGKVQLVFSNGEPSREACMTSSSIARSESDQTPNASNLITLYAGPSSAPTARILVQVDRATETQAKSLALHFFPETPANSYTVACNDGCTEVRVGPSKIHDRGLSVTFTGLKLTSLGGAGDVTITGTVDAR